MITITGGILLALLALWAFGFFVLMIRTYRCPPLRENGWRYVLCISAQLSLFLVLCWLIWIGGVLIFVSVYFALCDYIGG